MLGEPGRREDRVPAVGRDQRVRHRADAAAAPPGRLRVGGDADLGPTDLARDVRRVAVTGLDAIVIVPRRHEDDRLAVRGLEHAHDVARDQRAPCEHAEVDGLEVRKARVVALDRQYGLVRLDRIAIVERVDGQVVPVVRAELEHGDRLVDPAEVRVLLLKGLHDDPRVAPVAQEHLPRVVEVGVGVVALPHLLDGELEDLRREPLSSSPLHLPLSPARDSARARPRRPRAARGSARRSPRGAGARGPAWRAPGREGCPDCAPSS